MGLPVMTFPPTAATFRICFPANQRSISTICTSTLVLCGFIRSILSRHASSRRLRVTEAPNLIASPHSLTPLSSGILGYRLSISIHDQTITQNHSF